ncbi:hypothetical protein [Komagataeibacter saccharivorans]|uniref:hypothetical protein n=1 Tax=Komagataeibacter saccharivorans TaxID=265959 RepID=UPI000C85F457|nr:hypothetical protein [Komagataeibacter saccharivorans]
MMTAKSLAATLNGREYRNEITREECRAAHEACLVVVTGYSDDGVTIWGAIVDEIGAWNGRTFWLTPDGVLPRFETLCERADEAEMEKYFSNKAAARKIEAVWSPSEPDASWLIKSDVPHETFDIMEDDQLFCRGIVFALADLRAQCAGELGGEG